jgi:hypothetical protein
VDPVHQFEIAHPVRLLPDPRAYRADATEPDRLTGDHRRRRAERDHHERRLGTTVHAQGRAHRTFVEPEHRLDGKTGRGQHQPPGGQQRTHVLGDHVIAEGVVLEGVLPEGQRRDQIEARGHPGRRRELLAPVGGRQPVEAVVRGVVVVDARTERRSGPGDQVALGGIHTAAGGGRPRPHRRVRLELPGAVLVPVQVGPAADDPVAAEH